MAIRDYLLTKLAGQQAARQLALELEMAKAAREAQAQSATTGYLQQLLGAGTNLILAGAKGAEEQKAKEAKQFEEEVLTAALARATKQPEIMPIEERQLPLPAGVGVAAPGGFIYDKETIAGPTVKAPLQTLMPKTSISAANNINMQKQNITADMAGKPTAVSQAIPVKTTQEPQATTSTQEQIDKYLSMGLSENDARWLAGAPEKPMTEPTDAAKEYNNFLESYEAKKKGFEVTEPTGFGIRGARTKEEIEKEPLVKLPTFGVPPTVETAETKPVIEPEKAEVPVVSEAMKLPDIPEFKLKYGIDLEKPQIAKNISEAGKITGWNPPSFPEEEEKLAKEIVKEVEDKMPPDNPLTAFFKFGKESGDMQRARRMAQYKAQLTIRQARKEAIADSYEKYVKQQETERQAELDADKRMLLQAQASKAIAEATKTTVQVEQKAPLSGKDRELLNQQETANRELNRLISLGKKLIKSGRGIPLGPLRAVAAAGVTAMGADITSPTGTAINVGGLLGAGGGVQTSGGGKFIDDEKFNEAMKQIDTANLDADQRDFIAILRKVIQAVGKELEGGRVTDNDLRFYLDNLIVQDNPRVALQQINRLVEDNANRYGKNYGSLKETVTSGLSPYDSSLQYDTFTDEEIAAVQEASPAAMKQFAKESIPRRTADVARNIAGKGISELQVLLKAVTEKGDSEAAKQIADEIKKIRAAETNKPVTGSIDAFAD